MYIGVQFALSIRSTLCHEAMGRFLVAKPVTIGNRNLIALSKWSPGLGVLFGHSAGKARYMYKIIPSM